jgi:hypothetical protein
VEAKHAPINPHCLLTLGELLEAGLVIDNRYLRYLFEALKRWIDRPVRNLLIQPHDPSLPGNSGIDNLPGPESRQPEPSGCMSALTRLFSRQRRSR